MISTQNFWHEDIMATIVGTRLQHKAQVREDVNQGASTMKLLAQT